MLILYLPISRFIDLNAPGMEAGKADLNFTKKASPTGCFLKYVRRTGFEPVTSTLSR